MSKILSCVAQYVRGTETNELVKLTQCVWSLAIKNVFNMTSEDVWNDLREMGAMVLHWTSWTTIISKLHTSHAL
jgi:hypothetical protein